MATYSFKCMDCGCVFDAQATLKEKEKGGENRFACPKCRSKRILQQFSAANFVKNVFSGGDKGGGCCGPKKPGGEGGCCG